MTILSLAALFWTAAPADAQDYVQTIRAGKTQIVDGERVSPFHVEVAQVNQPGRIGYQITNLGDDWPHFTLVGIFYAHGHGVIANQRIKMKKGETFILSSKVSVPKNSTLAFRIKPRWLAQNFETRFRYIPIEDWQQAERETEATNR